MSREDILVDVSPKYSPEMKAEIKTTRKYALEMVILMAFPAVMSWYYYGGQAFRLMAFSVITAVAAEWLGSKLFRITATLSDFSAVATGLAIALCLPASAPIWLPCLASAFAILVVKLPFGNARSLMFSPTAAGIAFVTICMPDKVFAYPAILSSAKTALLGSAEFIEGDSLAYMLSQKNSIGINIISYLDVLIGNVPGPMGATCAIAMFGAIIYLFIRRPKTIAVSGSFLLVCFIYSILFPRVLTGRLISAFMEISSGLIIFSAVFFLSDEALLPKKLYARLAYGASAGLICMLIRSFGFFEDGTVFAILITNALVNAYDKLPYSKWEKKKRAEQRRKKREFEEQLREKERIDKLVGDEISDIEDTPQITAQDMEKGGAQDV